MLALKGFLSLVTENYVIYVEQYALDENKNKIIDIRNYAGDYWDAGDIIIDLPWCRVTFLGVLDAWDWVDRIIDYVSKNDGVLDLNALRGHLDDCYIDFDYDIRVERFEAKQ